MIVAGRGVRDTNAKSELQRVPEQFGASVVTTYEGKGVIADGHGSIAGTSIGRATPEQRDRLTMADTALPVGSDLDTRLTRGCSLALPDRLVHTTLYTNDIGSVLFL